MLENVKLMVVESLPSVESDEGDANQLANTLKALTAQLDVQPVPTQQDALTTIKGIAQQRAGMSMDVETAGTIEDALLNVRTGISGTSRRGNAMSLSELAAATTVYSEAKHTVMKAVLKNTVAGEAPISIGGSASLSIVLQRVSVAQASVDDNRSTKDGPKNAVAVTTKSPTGGEVKVMLPTALVIYLNKEAKTKASAEQPTFLTEGAVDIELSTVAAPWGQQPRKAASRNPNIELTESMASGLDFLSDNCGITVSSALATAGQSMKVDEALMAAAATDQGSSKEDIVFSILADSTKSNLEECRWWDGTGYSNAGCSICGRDPVAGGKTKVTCCCSHLTDFAITSPPYNELRPTPTPTPIPTPTPAPPTPTPTIPPTPTSGPVPRAVVQSVIALQGITEKQFEDLEVQNAFKSSVATSMSTEESTIKASDVTIKKVQATAVTSNATRRAASLQIIFEVEVINKAAAQAGLTSLQAEISSGGFATTLKQAAQAVGITIHPLATFVSGGVTEIALPALPAVPAIQYEESNNMITYVLAGVLGGLAMIGFVVVLVWLWIYQNDRKKKVKAKWKSIEMYDPEHIGISMDLDANTLSHHFSELSQHEAGFLSAALSMGVNQKRQALKQVTPGLDTSAIFALRHRKEKLTKKLAIIKSDRLELPASQAVWGMISNSLIDVSENALVVLAVQLEQVRMSETNSLAKSEDHHVKWPPLSARSLAITDTAITKAKETIAMELGYQSEYAVSSLELNVQLGYQAQPVERAFQKALWELLLNFHLPAQLAKLRLGDDLVLRELQPALQEAADTCSKGMVPGVTRLIGMLEGLCEPGRKKVLAEVEKEFDAAFAQFFERYDFDMSGTINDNEELEHLCINICFKYPLMKFVEADKIPSICAAKDLTDDKAMDVTTCREWFNENIRAHH